MISGMSQLSGTDVDVDMIESLGWLNRHRYQQAAKMRLPMVKETHHRLLKEGNQALILLLKIQSLPKRWKVYAI